MTMVRNCCLLIVVATFAATCVSGALAGGSFERIVAVGGQGASKSIKLRQRGPRSDAVLTGPAAKLPRGGYVRLYPFIGGLPAVPGRFYPTAQVICLYWHEPASNCSRLSIAGSKLLAPFGSLPLRYEAPTVPVAVRHRSRLLRYADGNIFAALELAIERPSVPRSAAPQNSIRLQVTWRGPRASQRPQQLLLTPIGVYARARLFPLGRWPWCYVAGNLRDAPIAVIEAMARVCI
jgi:hypothetical protein